MALRYKFVELSPVTDDTIETCVNEWVGQGWQLDGIRFVTSEHSKRPQMAFVAFTRDIATIPHEGRDDRPVVRDDRSGPAVITAAEGNEVD
jgi:hypothetical protein